jgi:Polymer-forming cytoskeletal
MTTIAAKTMVQGRVSGQGDLTVHGRVRGSVVLDGVLSLEPDGIIEAQASVARAIISGVFSILRNCASPLVLNFVDAPIPSILSLGSTPELPPRLPSQPRAQ